MITAQKLHDLLEVLSADTAIVAYEGEGVGLRVIGNKGEFGWIETGASDEEEVDESLHDLAEFAAPLLFRTGDDKEQER